MKPDRAKKMEPAPMTARQERQLREAEALRANLMRRKQQQRARPTSASSREKA
ncbi:MULTISPECIES: hypothetical protein [Bombella]|uniref:Transcriptional regulator n=2 Tax=Bombella TaxID=1654741 RepID=A0ABT3WJ18_9PROT|nr:MULTISPECIES: hypothetical protein [Bombella]MCT6855211.1 hypothetical protein [Bombella apis]MCX5614739.1 hypothetical protein [Bombella saccharophila]MCX5618908.1 hypothetical protein [Bombella pollinis]